MLELLVEIVGEFLLEAVGELLVELGQHALAGRFRRPSNRWLAALGYAILGATLGGLTLLVFPANLVPPRWRVVNLVLTPLAVGGLMAALGAWRARRGQQVLRIDRFSYGYLFALSLALVRFWFAK